MAGTLNRLALLPAGLLGLYIFLSAALDGYRPGSETLPETAVREIGKSLEPMAAIERARTFKAAVVVLPSPPATAPKRSQAPEDPGARSTPDSTASPRQIDGITGYDDPDTIITQPTPLKPLKPTLAKASPESTVPLPLHSTAVTEERLARLPDPETMVIDALLPSNQLDPAGQLARKEPVPPFDPGLEFSGQDVAVAGIQVVVDRTDNVVAKKVERAGRILLRQLERDSGPQVRIAWPDSRAARDRLYESLGACFGMKTALLDNEGRVWTADRRVSSSDGRVNLDLYSGFVREVEGEMPAAERQELLSIASRKRGNAIRLYPRRVDALMLGGLKQLIGDRYDTASSMRARYRLDGAYLELRDIAVDGDPWPGVIRIGCLYR